jgi:hypothetical protein
MIKTLLKSKLFCLIAAAPMISAAAPRIGTGTVECTDNAGNTLELIVTDRILGTLNLAAGFGQVNPGAYQVDLGEFVDGPVLLYSISANGRPLASLQMEGARLPDPESGPAAAHIYPADGAGELDLSCEAKN